MTDQPYLQPDFRNIKGAMGGYSQHVPKVTKKNLTAFFEEMQASGGLFDRTAELTWDEVWETLNHFQEFWVRYYNGTTRAVTVTDAEKPTWEAYLADIEAKKAAQAKTRLAGRIRTKAQLKK